MHMTINREGDQAWTLSLAAVSAFQAFNVNFLSPLLPPCSRAYDATNKSHQIMVMEADRCVVLYVFLCIFWQGYMRQRLNLKVILNLWFGLLAVQY